MLPIEVIHSFAAGEAAQQISLVLRPGEDIAIIEIVWHGVIMRLSMVQDATGGRFTFRQKFPPPDVIAQPEDMQPPRAD